VGAFWFMTKQKGIFYHFVKSKVTSLIHNAVMIKKTLNILETEPNIVGFVVTSKIHIFAKQFFPDNFQMPSTIIETQMYYTANAINH
jgi:hypothetical protein